MNEQILFLLNHIAENSLWPVMSFIVVFHATLVQTHLYPSVLVF